MNIHDRFSQKSGAGVEFTLTNVRTLAEEKTEFQSILIFENPAFGTVLAIDGVLQMSQRDQHLYHNGLVKPAATLAGESKRALVLGGGDGGAAAACMDHGFEKIDLVEIDERVVQLSQTYFPEIWEGLEGDDRVGIHFGDALRFVQTTSHKYDLIVCDFTDFERGTPSERVYGSVFYMLLANILTEKGVVSVQAGTPIMHIRVKRSILRNLSRAFPNVGTFEHPLAIFGAGSSAVCLGWKYPDLLRETTDRMTAPHSESELVLLSIYADILRS